MGLMNFLFVCPQYQKYSYQIKSKTQSKTTSKNGEELNILENNSGERKTLFSRDTKSDVYSPALREKREIQNETCNSVEIDFNCNDTKRSCRERCGDKVTMENATSFVCHCDELCTHYGDCCKDYAQQCQGCRVTEHGVDRNQTFIDIGDESCAPLSVDDTQRSDYKCTRVQGVVSVYLKASCHADFKGFALEKKCFGEGDTYSNIPCYDVIKGTHYKNKYCAECDYGEATMFWRLKIGCGNDYHFNRLKVGNVNIPQIMGLLQGLRKIGRGCQSEYLEPFNEDTNGIALWSSRPCIYTNSVCKFCEDTRLEALCQTIGLDPIEFHRNYYCWKCNLNREVGTQLYSKLCRLDLFAAGGKSQDDFQMFSFQILMDVMGDTINVKTLANEHYTRVAEVDLACSDDLIQCRLKRCLGNLKLVGDRCVIRDILVKVAITCKILLYSNLSTFISSYITSQIVLEVFPPLRIIFDTVDFKRGSKWVTKTYKFDVLFQDKANVSETFNKTMVDKFDQLKGKLDGFLLSHNLSNHAVLIGIEYNVPTVQERTNSMVAQNSSTATVSAVSTSIRKSAHCSAGTTPHTFIFPMLIWIFIFKINVPRHIDERDQR
ncbi:unnamed protein product [Owenia fusiformis]|uniref:SMB domain-containing protein n=1 Tax=Owenia fusiformis TaxID=6347 RepID=A0A8S4NBJ1_OWEFU|nr:unnamed protein product [Owenia fusiformis]